MKKKKTRCKQCNSSGVYFLKLSGNKNACSFCTFLEMQKLVELKKALEERLQELGTMELRSHKEYEEWVAISECLRVFYYPPSSLH